MGHFHMFRAGSEMTEQHRRNGLGGYDQAHFVWSCHAPLPGTNNVQQSICISKLITPTKLDSAISVISHPTEAWEQFGRPLNEGPQPMYWDGEI
jgi:hypothetical protein